MKNVLHFVCPTDGLESVIDEEFESKNFFYTSLGNSVSFSSDVLKHIKEMIQDCEITDICFTLSDKNQILQDAVFQQQYVSISGLAKFYDQVNRYDALSDLFLRTSESQELLLCRHLSSQMNHLKNSLGVSSSLSDRISGLVYRDEDKTFCGLYTNLIYVHPFSLC